jgi:hypothetical protein
MSSIGGPLLFISLPGIITGTLCGLIVLAIALASDVNVAVGLLASCCASSIFGSIANGIFINSLTRKVYK